MERYSFWPNWYIGDMMADLLADAGDCRAYRYTRESAFGEPEAEAVLQVMTVAGTEEAAIREKLEKIGALRQYPVFLVPEETHIEAAPDGRGQTVYLRLPAAEPLGRYADGNRLEEKDLDSLEQQLRDALAICGSRGISYGEIRPGDLFVGADGRLLLGASALLRKPGAAVQSPEQLRGVLLTAAGAAAGAAGAGTAAGAGAAGRTETVPETGTDGGGKGPRVNRPVLIAICAGLFLLSAFLFYRSIHIYSEPTCTEPAVCKICGKIGQAALGHAWNPATCTEPEICSRCGATQGSFLGHDFLDATCTEPETCSRCGVTQGQPLGHDYADATCTEPGTCSRCGATTGTALGHDYAEATCTEPKTCKRCGATTGSALGHSWKDATYDKPKTCSRCGETQGNVKGYVSGSELAKGEWSEGTFTLQDFNTHAWLLDNPLKKCRKITISLTITEVSKGSANTTWGFYVRSGNSWKEAGRFTVSEINKEYKNTFKISPSMDVDAFMFEPISRREISWRSSYRFYEAQVD